MSGVDVIPSAITLLNQGEYQNALSLLSVVSSSSPEWQTHKQEIKNILISRYHKQQIGDDALYRYIKLFTEKGDKTEAARMWMCKKYFDIRTFGAVMSTGKNAGQVRGPIQLTFARSVDTIVALEHSITRLAVTTEREAEEQSGDNRTMGRKYTVPYGLYRTHGFISAHLANDTKFSEDDLKLFWEAVQKMFEEDHSAARGEMNTRKIIAFKHKTALGSKPAHELFARVTHKKLSEAPARDYSDYEIYLDGKTFPETFKVVDVE